MTAEDYKSVDTVKQALGSIARLGRAAGTHLALACQRAQTYLGLNIIKEI